MATVTIDTDHDADEVPPYVQGVTLDGVTYRLGFRWNARAAVWILTIADEADVVIVDSVPVRNGLPLTAFHKAQAGVPQGDFVAVAVSDPRADAGQAELGGRVLLAYIGAA